MKIRKETIKDYAEVYKVNYDAFGNRDNEAQLVERIRDSKEFIPDLSIVAEANNEILGHVLISKALVVNNEKSHDVLVLAPVAVKKDYQKLGIGSKLIEFALKKCEQLNGSLVLLIGHPTYYPKFGFKPAGQFGLELKQFEVPEEVFMVYEVKPGKLDEIKGELKYPATFF